jgi:hypothetical protein
MKRSFLVAGAGLVGLAWISYALLGNLVAIQIASRWGAELLHLGDGKFSDPAVFVQHRLFEAVWLLTLTVGVLVLTISVGTLWAKRITARWKWVPYSVTAFVGFNLWVKLAAASCLFWFLFWTKQGAGSDLPHFFVKLFLAQQDPAPIKIILGGSSQTRAQIDEHLLNQHLGSNCLVAKLFFPGNRAYDLLLLDRHLRGHQANVIVCYVSEANFFWQGALNGSFPFVSTVSDAFDFLRLGGQTRWGPRGFGYGVLGDLMPVFRLRDALAQKFYGEELVSIRQKQQDASLTADLNQRAKEAAAQYVLDAQSGFQTRAFETFVARCRSEKRIVVICCGQVNPILAQELNPALRLRFLAFLGEIAKKYDNIVLLDQQSLPPQSEQDYEDLTHVNRAAQLRFTQALGQALDRLLNRNRLDATAMR